MSIGAVKASNARTGRLEKLVTRWRELAEAGYRRNGSDSAGWAEHIERLSAQPVTQESDANSDVGPASHPTEEQNGERQLDQGSLSAHGLAPFVTAPSRRQ